MRVELCDDALGFNNGCVFSAADDDSGDEGEGNDGGKRRTRENPAACDVVKDTSGGGK